VYFLRPAAGGVIAVSSSGIVHNVDANKGAVRWRTALEGPVEAEPTAFMNDLLVVSGSKLRTVSLDNGNGSVTNGIVGDVTAIGVSKDGSFTVGDGRGLVSALSGPVVRWKFRSGGAISSVLPLERSLLVASHDNFVYYISSKEGYVEWRRRLPGRILSVTFLSDRWAIAETQEDQSPLVVLDLDNGKTAAQLHIGSGESVADRPFIKNDAVIFVTNSSVQKYSSSDCGKKESGTPSGALPPSQKN
jgi:outer membrane protein assembly factor BamB